MKSITSAQRPYQEVGAIVRGLATKTPYNPGERLPLEREVTEMLDITWAMAREALTILEIKGLMEVRRDTGIYILDSPDSHSADSPSTNIRNDASLLELLQTRQLLESNIAELAVPQVTREDIAKTRRALQLKERELAFSAPGSNEDGDIRFHLAITEATHNSMLVKLFRQFQQQWKNNPMWVQLYSHLDDSLYRKEWLGNHKQIPTALIEKDARTAKLVTWQHLKDAKRRLLEFSNADNIHFDGYLLDSWSLDKVNVWPLISGVKSNRFALCMFPG